MELIYETGTYKPVKVYKREDGAYIVEEKRMANFDGFVEPVVHREVFDEMGQHDDGPVVRHNLMYVYADGNRPIRDRAIEYANSVAG